VFSVSYGICYDKNHTQSESDFIRKIEKHNDSTNNHNKFICGPNYPLTNHIIITKTKVLLIGRKKNIWQILNIMD